MRVPFFADNGGGEEDSGERGKERENWRKSLSGNSAPLPSATSLLSFLHSRPIAACYFGNHRIRSSLPGFPSAHGPGFEMMVWGIPVAGWLLL